MEIPHKLFLNESARFEYKTRQIVVKLTIKQRSIIVDPCEEDPKLILWVRTRRRNKFRDNLAMCVKTCFFGHLFSLFALYPCKEDKADVLRKQLITLLMRFTPKAYTGYWEVSI